MTKVVLATRNKNKINELRTFFKELSDLDITVLSLDDIGYYGEIEENGTTFEENAIAKASVPARLGYIGIADDSGICVDYLGGAPGIYSARYSGGDDEDNNDKLLQELEGVEKEKRTAHYACSISCCFPDGREISAEGKCYGYIGFERQGTGGFGYDPLFITEKGCFGELSPAEKDEMSHRGNALRILKEKLESENLK